jgi:hypothetical protein
LLEALEGVVLLDALPELEELVAGFGLDEAGRVRDLAVVLMCRTVRPSCDHS